MQSFEVISASYMHIFKVSHPEGKEFIYTKLKISCLKSKKMGIYTSWRYQPDVEARRKLLLVKEPAMKDQTLSALVRKTISGDPEAFEQLMISQDKPMAMKILRVKNLFTQN